MEKKHGGRFNKLQLNDVKDIISLSLNDFIDKYYEEISLLKVLIANPIVTKEVTKILLKTHETQKENKEIVPKLTSSPEEIILSSEQSPEYNVKTTATSYKNSRKVNPSIKQSNKFKNKSKENLQEFKNIANKTCKISRNVYKTSTYVDLRNSTGSYDKIDSSNDLSLDDLLPNPFIDPLENLNEKNVEDKYKKIRAGINGTTLRKSKKVIPNRKVGRFK